MTLPITPGRPTGRPADRCRRIARPAVVVPRRPRRGRARRVRPGRPGRDARRRGRPRDPRPGGRRGRGRLGWRDAPGRVLHGRVLSPPRRRPAAAAGAPARCRRPRSAAPPRGHRADRGARTVSGWSPSIATQPGGRAGRSRSPCRGRTRCRVGSSSGPNEVYRDRVAAAEAFVPLLQAELRALVDGRGLDHPGRRAVAGDPPRRRGRLQRPVQRGDRAGHRAGAARCPPVLRELPRSAARQADLPSDPRRDAPVPGRRARPRVRQPRAGRARDRRRGGGGRARRRGRGRSTSRTPTSRRPTTSPSGSIGCWPPGVPPDRLDGRPRLWLQPDGARPDGGRSSGRWWPAGTCVLGAPPAA